MNTDSTAIPHIPSSDPTEEPTSSTSSFSDVGETNNSHNDATADRIEREIFAELLNYHHSTQQAVLEELHKERELYHDLLVELSQLTSEEMRQSPFSNLEHAGSWLHRCALNLAIGSMMFFIMLQSLSTLRLTMRNHQIEEALKEYNMTVEQHPMEKWVWVATSVLCFLPIGVILVVIFRV
ncbi:hypothetical protein ABW19_dt0201785 [Dactylella cylindrospora]|nr:hypothetical protein ABW19_dt0201785 [Dactylella cylindrospora]